MLLAKDVQHSRTLVWAVDCAVRNRINDAVANMIRANCGTYLTAISRIHRLVVAAYHRSHGMVETTWATIPHRENAKPEQCVDLRFLERLEKRGLLNELYREAHEKQVYLTEGG